jgi:hypothetical protein
MSELINEVFISTSQSSFLVASIGTLLSHIVANFSEQLGFSLLLLTALTSFIPFFYLYSKYDRKKMNPIVAFIVGGILICRLLSYAAIFYCLLMNKSSSLFGRQEDTASKTVATDGKSKGKTYQNFSLEMFLKFGNLICSLAAFFFVEFAVLSANFFLGLFCLFPYATIRDD